MFDNYKYHISEQKGEYMSIKKEKIPIVRFKDFSEPWF